LLAHQTRYWADLVWVLGVLLVPVGLLTLLLTMVWQRPDRTRRAAAGVPVGLDLSSWVARSPEQSEPGPDEEPSPLPHQGRDGRS
jgi:hypothetical protein